MPTYVYRREDGTTFEIEQRITADPLEVDPETGQKVERIISGSAGLIFKGDGFYLTDYARSGNGKKPAKEAEGQSSDAGAAASTDASDSSGDGSASSTSASSSTD